MARLSVVKETVDSDIDSATAEMLSSYEKQRAAYLDAPEPAYRQRLLDLKTLRRMLITHRQEIKDAINRDYGTRSNIESNLADIGSSLLMINHIIKHLKSWMSPQRRGVGIAFLGGKSRLIPQPLGVVGVIVPWNFPIYLALPPIATAFAAGNRVMVKMSENSRHLAKVLMDISPRYFPRNKLCFVDESGGVGIEFSKIPFDLLMFTGSPSTAKSVMAAAAKNLTPVILELGGKNPVIIDPDYPLAKAVDRVVFAKQTNAGQVCLNVDYVFVHEDQLDEFVSLTKAAAKKMVPDINSPYFTAIIDDPSVTRLENTLRDAEEKGAQVIKLSDQEINHQQRKFPMHLVVNPSPEMEISQRETFGPIFTVRTYREPQQVVAHINAGERPLGLYVFSHNKKLTQHYVSRTMSGGVTVNDIALHAAQDDLPFGGVGHSGMGHYHGFEGFQAFSKMRPVFYQARFSVLNILTPPYKGVVKRLLDM